jgi:hypothetical protein
MFRNSCYLTVNNREAESSEVKRYLMWREAKCNKVKWSERSKGSEMRRSGVQYRGGGVFMEKVYRSSKWWEVKDWGESVSELVIGKKDNNKKLYTALSYLSVFTFCTCCKILICLVCIVASFMVVLYVIVVGWSCVLL